MDVFIPMEKISAPIKCGGIYECAIEQYRDSDGRMKMVILSTDLFINTENADIVVALCEAHEEENESGYIVYSDLIFSILKETIDPGTCIGTIDHKSLEKIYVKVHEYFNSITIQFEEEG